MHPYRTELTYAFRRSLELFAPPLGTTCRTVDCGPLSPSFGYDSDSIQDESTVILPPKDALCVPSTSHSLPLAPFNGHQCSFSTYPTSELRT